MISLILDDSWPCLLSLSQSYRLHTPRLSRRHFHFLQLLSTQFMVNPPRLQWDLQYHLCHRNSTHLSWLSEVLSLFLPGAALKVVFYYPVCTYSVLLGLALGFLFSAFGGGVAQCVWLCYPMDCSTPGFPVLHYLLELAQTHVHWVRDAI